MVPSLSGANRRCSILFIKNGMDCSRPMSTYNSLTDPNLAGFFTNRRLRKHLRRSGLVSRDGRVATETTYRMFWTRHEQQLQMHEILAKAILNKTLDMERTRQAEIRNKIDEISKLELVRRMREEKEYNKRRENTFPMLTPHSSRSRQLLRPDNENDSKFEGERRRTQSAGAPHMKAHHHKRDESDYSSDDNNYDFKDRYTETKPRSSNPRVTRTRYEPYQEVPHELQSLKPAPPRGQRSTGGSARLNHRRLQSAKPVMQVHHDETLGANVTLLMMNLSTIRMHYFGPNLKLDTANDFEARGDLIIVDQQPSGCSTHTMFRDYVKRGSDFSFESRRYRTHTFSLTLYVNGQQDCRLSTCCEYKHKPGARLGGANGHFAIVSVDGSGPCYRCQFEEEEKKELQKKIAAKKEQKKKAKLKQKQAAIDNEKLRKKEQNKQPEEPVLNIPVEEAVADEVVKKAVEDEAVVAEEGNTYEDDFEEANNEKHASAAATSDQEAFDETSPEDREPEDNEPEENEPQTVLTTDGLQDNADYDAIAVSPDGSREEKCKDGSHEEECEGTQEVDEKCEDEGCEDASHEKEFEETQEVDEKCEDEGCEDGSHEKECEETQEVDENCEDEECEDGSHEEDREEAQEVDENSELYKNTFEVFEHNSNAVEEGHDEVEENNDEDGNAPEEQITEIEDEEVKQELADEPQADENVVKSTSGVNDSLSDCGSCCSEVSSSPVPSRPHSPTTESSKN